MKISLYRLTEKQRQERKERYKYVKEHINSGNGGNQIVILMIARF